MSVYRYQLKRTSDDDLCDERILETTGNTPWSDAEIDLFAGLDSQTPSTYEITETDITAEQTAKDDLIADFATTTSIDALIDSADVTNTTELKDLLKKLAHATIHGVRGS